MRSAILLNRTQASLRITAKRVLSLGYEFFHGDKDVFEHGILPEYDSFASVIDEHPVILGTGDKVDWPALRNCEVLFWEWGWTDVPPRSLLEIRSQLPQILTVMFTGPLDRFWRELNPKDLSLQFKAARETDVVGCMLADTNSFYRAMLPHAHVFHMPVPLDVSYFSKFAAPVSARKKNRLLLTAPTRFTGPASQIPITTYLVFRNLVSRFPGLEGLCFTYSDSERAEAQEVFRELGISKHIEIKPYLRPIFRYFREMNDCYAGVFLPHAILQGRTALITACLGIPMLLSDDIDTHKLLYPETIVKWYDIDHATALASRLLEDPDFYSQTCNYAREHVDYYSIDKCRKRMLDAIAEGFRNRKPDFAQQ